MNSERSQAGSLRGPNRAGAGIVAVAAGFGIVVSSVLVAVVVAGALQWGSHVPPMVDDGAPLVVLAMGMALAGRVTVDVAGRLGVASAVGTAALVAILGTMLGKASEAHGDGIEGLEVTFATAAVLVVVGGTAWLVRHRRVARGDL